MIHAFALEPRLVATWGRREEFRFIHDKFGLGTPRALLELPAFSKWKRAVYAAAAELGLSQEDMKRIEELFRVFGEHKIRRVDSVYDGLLAWLENAEREYDRRPFAAILTTENPRGHQAVLVGDQLGPANSRWTCAMGATPARTPEALATALSAMLVNCKALHLVDPHFGPENARHRKVLEVLMDVIGTHGLVLEVIRVHCSEKSSLAFFEQEAAKMAASLPRGISVEFARWRQRGGGEKLHNRYVLTDLGGVALGIGLDAGEAGETDDLLLLPRAQYERRWAQYVANNGAFDRVDSPASVQGTRVPGSSKGNRR
ncbi:MAG TPA: hypothetical protein VF469_25135 [Kofleriaceae bacterium]